MSASMTRNGHRDHRWHARRQPVERIRYHLVGMTVGDQLRRLGELSVVTADQAGPGHQSHSIQCNVSNDKIYQMGSLKYSVACGVAVDQAFDASWPQQGGLLSRQGRQLSVAPPLCHTDAAQEVVHPSGRGWLWL